MTGARIQKLPMAGTAAHHMVMALYAAPGHELTLKQLGAMLPRVRQHTMTEAARTWDLQVGFGVFRLPTTLLLLLEGAAVPEEGVKSTLVTPPHVFNAWTPAMVGYEAAMRRGMRA